jgi:hypothetical protein
MRFIAKSPASDWYSLGCLSGFQLKESIKSVDMQSPVDPSPVNFYERRAAAPVVLPPGSDDQA